MRASSTVPADGRFRTNGEGAERISDGDERFELGDVVEPALARALVLAAEAGRWRLVEGIAAELRARSRHRAEEGAGLELARGSRSRGRP